MYSENTETQSGRPFKVLGYARVSTNDQVDGVSLEFQETAIRQYCQAQGWILTEMFVDVGSGADTENRPEYRRLLKSIKKADAVAAHKVDRLGRNAKEVLTLLDYLKALNKPLRVVECPVDPNTAIGRFVVTLMAAVAELERILIIERTSMGRNAKAQKGSYAYGAPPFGWRVHEGELIESPSEQAIIKLIQGWRKLKWSLREIADKLTKDGYKTKRGGRWHASIVSKILKGKGKNAK